MSEKWTKARCERELKDPKNWETDFIQGYIWEESFEFYSVKFVRFRLSMANSEWEMINGKYMPIAMHDSKWEATGRLYLVMKDQDGSWITALAEINKPIAINMMMEAVKKEGYL